MCLAETDVEQLEPQWARLDELWMSVRHHIQVVHDIEYGYGDPLRTKASPAFLLLDLMIAMVAVPTTEVELRWWVDIRNC